jgi:hypothetical protein
MTLNHHYCAKGCHGLKTHDWPVEAALVHLIAAARRLREELQVAGVPVAAQG